MSESWFASARALARRCAIALGVLAAHVAALLFMLDAFLKPHPATEPPELVIVLPLESAGAARVSRGATGSQEAIGAPNAPAHGARVPTRWRAERAASARPPTVLAPTRPSAQQPPAPAIPAPPAVDWLGEAQSAAQDCAVGHIEPNGALLEHIDDSEPAIGPNAVP